MNLEVATPISAEAEVKKYTLVGDDIYVKRYTNEDIPDWYRQLISDIIATDNTITDLDAAVDYLSTLPAGYNQMITELQLADTTINTSLESLVATTGSHSAAIANLGITKVDATSAAAIARDTVGAYFADGTAGAWFDNQISTYASDIAANAMNISTLSATLDSQTVSIDTVESISIAKAQVIRSDVAPTISTHPLLQIGDLWVNTTDNITKSWDGTAWVDTSNTDASTAYTWSANASKLITNPNGQITGWSFGDGSNTKSFFDIYADNFRVVNSTYNFVPFSISGSSIVFNGKVSFTNVTGVPPINQTFIQATAPTSGMVAGDTWLDSDGGYAVYTYTGSSWVPGGSKTYSQVSAPTSGMVAGDLWVDTDDNNKLYRYNGTSWVNQTITSGGIISAINGTTNTTTIDGGKITTDSITAKQIQSTAINGFSIEGTFIKGAYIEGSVIRSSWIDYSSSGELTNWKYYTASTIPHAYESNFAHNSIDGTLVIDGNGYVRLQGIRTLYSIVGSHYARTSSTTATLAGTGVYDSIASYNSYTTSNVRRMIDTACYIENEEFTLLSVSQGNYAVYDTYITIMGNVIRLHATNPSGENVNYVTVYKNGTSIGSRRVYGAAVDVPLGKTDFTFTIECFTFTLLAGSHSCGLSVSANSRTYTFTSTLMFDGLFSNATIQTNDAARPGSCNVTIPQIMIQSQ